MADKEIGAAPIDINPEDVLLGTETDGVGDPSIEDFAYVPPTGFSSPGAGGTQVIRAGFTSDESVPEHIQRTLNQLSSIQRFFHGRDIQRIKREHVLKLSTELFQYQYQDMQHLLMLGMDVQKKTRFVQYLNATKDIQDKIQRQSAEAQLQIVNTMFDNRIAAYKRKNARDAELAGMLRDRIIDEKQYAKSRRDNERMMEEHVQRLDQTAEMLITRHGEFLYKTLELFKTDLLSQGKL